MANTKIPSELSSTPSISDSGNATAITITSDENIGIGTASPNQDGFDANAKVLTIKSANNGEGVLELIGGGNSSGDQIAVINFMSQNLTNPAGQIKALRGSADDEAGITFHNSGAQRMAINADGNVTISKGLTVGTTVQPTSGQLDGVGQSGTNVITIGDTTKSYPAILMRSNATNGNWLSHYSDSSGNLATYNTDTDRRVMQTTPNGEITMLYQPAFDVSSASATNQGTTKTFGTVYVNKGSHYSTSNGRFTAPIAGTYLFYTSYIKNGSTATHRRGFIKNGTTSPMIHNGRQLRLDSNSGTEGVYGDNGYLIAMITLAANDYIQVYQQAGNSYGSHNYEVFGGYLIG